MTPKTVADVLALGRIEAGVYVRSVESNVVQDRIVHEAVSRALAAVEPYLVVQEPPRVTVRSALHRWFVQPFLDLWDEMTDRRDQ